MPAEANKECKQQKPLCHLWSESFNDKFFLVLSLFSQKTSKFIKAEDDGRKKSLLNFKQIAVYDAIINYDIVDINGVDTLSNQYMYECKMPDESQRLFFGVIWDHPLDNLINHFS